MRPGGPWACLEKVLSATYHETPEGAGFVDSAPSDAQDEDGADGRRQIRRDRLNVVEELRSLSRFDDRDPQDRHHQENQDEETTHDHQLDLRRGEGDEER